MIPKNFIGRICTDHKLNNKQFISIFPLHSEWCWDQISTLISRQTER